MVLTSGEALARLTWRHIPALLPGRIQHFTMERVDRSIRLEIDGALAIEYQGIGGMDAPDRPTFGFEGVVDPVEISHVRVFTRSPPLLVPPLAVPDALYRAGDWQHACDAYSSLSSAYPGTEIAARASFGSCLALAREGRVTEADTALAAFVRDHPQHQDVPFAIWERVRLAELSHDDALEERLRQDLVRFRGQPVLDSVINELSEDRCALIPRAAAHAVGDVTIPPGAIASVERACRELARWSQAYGVSWANTRFCNEAMMWLEQAGCDRFIIPLLADMDDAAACEVYDRAMVTIGEHRALLSDPRTRPRWRERVRCDMLDATLLDAQAVTRETASYFKEVRARQRLQVRLMSEGPAAVAPEIALAQARARTWAEARIKETDLDMVMSHACLMAGRDDEVLARHPAQFDDVSIVALKRLQADRAPEGAALVRAMARMSWFIEYSSQDSDHAFGMSAAHDLVPMLLELDEGKPVDFAALEATARDRCGQQLWYLVRFARGEIDDTEFRTQPVQLNLDDRLALAKGLRAEWAHDSPAALAAYRQVLMPAWEPDVLGHIVQWRRMRLGDRY